MILKKVTIHDILSVKEAEVEFSDSGLVLVEGFDYDTNRANGAGKSAVFNAISFGLYDKLPRKITKSEITRKGAKKAKVEVLLESDTHEYKVVRHRPSAVEFYKDGNKLDITQEEFESIIGLNYNQFLTTVYNAQDSDDRFINLNDTGKKDFLLRVMNLGNFKDYKDHISSEVSKIENQLEILNTKLQGFKNSIDIYKQQSVSSDEIQSKIDQLDKDIEFYKSKIITLQQVQQPDMSKFKQLEDSLENKLRELHTVKLSIAQKRNEHDNLKHLKPDDNCPECNTELIVSSNKVFKLDKETTEQKMQELSKEINELEAKTLKEQEFLKLRDQINTKKQEALSEYNSAQSTISEYKNYIQFKNTEKESLSMQLQRSQDNSSRVANIISDAKDTQGKITSLEQEQDVLKTVLNIFEPTGAPAYIMDSIVDSFNDYVSDYISEIWPNASYSLQTYKQNKDKTVTSKFSESLVINGKEASIGSLSGGELRALSLATDFAIIDVLSSKFSININPILLDEPMNGLDAAGKEIVIDMLSNMSRDRQICMIDHSSEAKAMFDRVIRVEKRNGISVLHDL